MKAVLGLLLLASLSTSIFTSAPSVPTGSVQKDGTNLLKDWTGSLNKRESISATISIQQVGGTKTSYTVDFKKPNTIRIDSKEELVIGDGKEITVYEKKNKIFYKKPQTEAEFKDLLRPDVFAILSPFFNPNTLKPVKTKELPAKVIAGESLKVLETTFGKKGNKKILFYIPTDMIVRKAEIQLTPESGEAGLETQVITAKVTTAAPADELFAFKAPEGVEEVKYEDIVASRWFGDFDEAAKIATRADKLVLIEFMASWSTVCRRLANEVHDTDDFKALGKKAVFCKIDADEQPFMAEKYQVEAIPFVVITKPDGTVVGSVLGYAGKEQFLSEVRAILGIPASR